jgi:hypothetical protein
VPGPIHVGMFQRCNRRAAAHRLQPYILHILARFMMIAGDSHIFRATSRCSSESVTKTGIWRWARCASMKSERRMRLPGYLKFTRPWSRP